MSKTLEQMRAADALEKVNGLRSEGEEWKDKYASYAAGLPAAILMNGLGQAAATLRSAAKDEEDPHYVLFNHLKSWLCRDDSKAPYPKVSGLMKAITSYDRDTYMYAQAEALAWLQWLKKFATAYLKKPEGDRK